MGHRRIPVLVTIWLTVNSAWSPPIALAKEEGSRNLLDDLPSLFSLPLQVLFIKKHESAWRNLVSGVTVGTTLDYPLKSTSRQTGAGAESQGECGANGATVSMSLKYNPSSDWLFSTTLSK